MPGTQNFSLVKEAVSPSYARTTVFNQFADQVDAAMSAFKTEAPSLVQVRNMLDDSDQVGAAPGAPANGDAYVVNNWGVGNYVGAYVGAYADGDIAEYVDALTGWVRVLANAAGTPPPNTRVLVGPAGVGGSFAAMADQIAQFNGTWTVPFPTVDGMRALVVGEQGVYENQMMIYDTIVAGWISTGVLSILFANLWFVDKVGNDTTGSGTIERPFLTIGAAHAAAAPGDSIIVGQGNYVETLIIDQNITIHERVPGTVVITSAVVGGPVVLVRPAPVGAGVRINASIVNSSGTGPGDIALHVDNTPGLGNGWVRFGGKILSGGPAGTALQVDGNVAVTSIVYLDNVEQIVGGILKGLQNPLDLVQYNNCLFVGGLPAWMTITGAGGRVVMANSLQPVAAAGEILNFGGGGACGVNLSIGSSVLAGNLDLNNLAGTGIVVLTAGTQIGSIAASSPLQILQKWLGEDEFKIALYNIDANPGAPPVVYTMYTVGGGRRFAPHTARTINRNVATGAALNYQFDGSAPASVVAPLGAGVLAQGIRNEIVLQDTIGPAGTLDFQVLAADGVGAILDAEVIGRLF